MLVNAIFRHGLNYTDCKKFNCCTHKNYIIRITTINNSRLAAYCVETHFPQMFHLSPTQNVLWL